MIADLRRKILAVADGKMASGAIVIYSLTWAKHNRGQKGLTVRQREEELVVLHFGFLM